MSTHLHLPSTSASASASASPSSSFPRFPSWNGLKKSRHPSSSSSLSPFKRTHSPSSFKILSLLDPLHQHSTASPLSPPHPLPSLRAPPSLKPSTLIPSAGRSKKKSNSGSGGRIEGSADFRRQAKQNARRRSRRLSQNLFYRRNSSRSSSHPDSFSEDELNAIGLGYDRAVRFMSQDDPDLRHPHDWYKYGQYGPYSWRGVVVGPPIRGRFSDADRVSLIGEVKDHEEWEQIEQFDMCQDFSPRLQSLDSTIGFRYYWVFARHPKWRASELPWQQWTLVSEVAVEASKQQRLDKWNLMGRFGNKTRAMITQCAAWFRPDIIYVKKPVYQCRFEPQDGFFSALMPLVDPVTEGGYLFELTREDGRVEMCTYFSGLCKIVRVNPKSYVDDVVNAYEKMSDERKSRCLEFLLKNHPVELLHPYTKEWKAKLEELELGCDAPDESDDDNDAEKNSVTDWIEDYDDEDHEDEDEDEDDNEDEEGSEDDAVIDVGKDVESKEEAERKPEETVEYWDEQWKKAISSAEIMEKVVTKSVEVSTKFYKQQMMEEQREKERMEEARRMRIDRNWEKGGEDWESKGYTDSRKTKVKKSKIPPELFLRAAVRPFTYRNLVKEIVLMRHAILDGDIKRS